jgi:hypothetical protein
MYILSSYFISDLLPVHHDGRLRIEIWRRCSNGPKDDISGIFREGASLRRLHSLLPTLRKENFCLGEWWRWSWFTQYVTVAVEKTEVINWTKNVQKFIIHFLLCVDTIFWAYILWSYRILIPPSIPLISSTSSFRLSKTKRMSKNWAGFSKTFSCTTIQRNTASSNITAFNPQEFDCCRTVAAALKV